MSNDNVKQNDFETDAYWTREFDRAHEAVDDFLDANCTPDDGGIHPHALVLALLEAACTLNYEIDGPEAKTAILADIEDFFREKAASGDVWE